MCGEGGIVAMFKVVCISYSPHPFSMICTLVGVELDVEDGVDEVVASVVVDEWMMTSVVVPFPLQDNSGNEEKKLLMNCNIQMGGDPRVW